MNPPAIHRQSTKKQPATSAIHSIHQIHAAPRTYAPEHIARQLRKRVLPRVCINARGYRGLVDCWAAIVFLVDCRWIAGGFFEGMDK